METKQEKLPISRPRWGIDLDGVVYRFDATARFLLKWHFGIDVPVPNRWDGVKEAAGREAWRWLWNNGIKHHGLFRHGHLYKGSVEALKELARLGDVVIVTSRPNLAKLDTMDFLRYHQIPLSELNFVAQKSQIPCDIYYDDSPEVVDDLLRNTESLVCLQARPWNGGYKPPKGHAERYCLVGGWPGFVGVVDRWLNGRTR